MEHRNYLQMEEEKRRRARVVRKVVEGPKIRWISRGEEVRVHVPVPVPAPIPYRYGYTGGSGYYSYQAVGGQHYPNVVPNTPGSETPHYPNVVTNQPSATLSLSTSTTVLSPTTVYYPNQTQQPQPQTSYYYSAHPPSQQPLPQPVTHLEKFCKNYVVHETSQNQSQTHPPLKPAWEETMAALFGGDVKWEDLKVWNGKARPLCTFSSLFYYTFRSYCTLRLARVTQTCPLTGLPAPYLDPRTNVPFANLRAYDTLTKLLKHEYVWSDRLGCYLNKEGERRAMGIEGRVKGRAKEKEKTWTLGSDAMDVS
jgi:YL1 nuclear protein C-terminal domain